MWNSNKSCTWNFEKEIGVIATEGTIRSKSWEKAIKKELPDIEVINKSCPMLAEIAEEGKARSKEGRAKIKEYMKRFKEREIKNIILGCTHYPIYEKIIKEELKYDVRLVNTGNCVANYLDCFLENENMKAESKEGKFKIFLSKNENMFESISKNILNKEVEIYKK